MSEDKSTDTDTGQGAVDPKPFATFLIEHARGRSHDELSHRLRELLEAIENTGKGGSITYKLTVKPETRAEHAVLVTDEIKTSLPQLDRPASIFFVDNQMRLQRNDPRQLSLENMTDEDA